LRESKLIKQRGFSEVLDRPSLIDSIATTLHTPNLKLRIQITDLLSALCVLSADEGQPSVLDALTESALRSDEAYRFEWLIRSLIPISGEDIDLAIWEWRTAVMGFVNALVGASDLLEERCSLRGELRRRGLDEVLEVSLIEEATNNLVLERPFVQRSLSPSDDDLHR
jgi:diaphanous 1